MFHNKTISACIIMHNDHDILSAAIESLAAYADEFVIIDGAYAWAAPFLAVTGSDASRSDAATMEVIDRLSKTHKIRYHTGVWRNELEKRTFSYQQCSGDLVYLLDADEVHEIDEAALTEFIESPHTVASVASPLFARADCICTLGNDSLFPPKPVLFKRSAISAEEHLKYLWLIVSDKEREQISGRDFAAFFGPMIGHNYHLSHMRTPSTAINRAKFYVFTYFRSVKETGWFGGITFKDEDDFSGFFEHITPQDFNEMMRGHSLSLGIDPHQKYRTESYQPSQPALGSIQAVDRKFRAACKAELQRATGAGAAMMRHQGSYFDISPDIIDFEFCTVSADQEGFTVSAQVFDMMRDGVSTDAQPVTIEKHGDGWRITAPPIADAHQIVRRTLAIQPGWPDAQLYVTRVRVEFN